MGNNEVAKRRGASSLTIPRKRLGDAHVSEAPSGDDSMEFFETMFEGDRARRLGRRVAVPAAELGDDPAGPCEAFLSIWVFLQRCGALELGVEFVEHGNLVCAEGERGRFAVGRGAGLHELHGGDRGLGGDGGELDEPLCGFDLTVFDTQAPGVSAVARTARWSSASCT